MIGYPFQEMGKLPSDPSVDFLTELSAGAIGGHFEPILADSLQGWGVFSVNAADAKAGCLIKLRSAGKNIAKVHTLFRSISGTPTGACRLEIFAYDESTNQGTGSALATSNDITPAAGRNEHTIVLNSISAQKYWFQYTNVHGTPASNNYQIAILPMSIDDSIIRLFRSGGSAFDDTFLGTFYLVVEYSDGTTEWCPCAAFGRFTSNAFTVYDERHVGCEFVIETRNKCLRRLNIALGPVVGGAGPGNALIRIRNENGNTVAESNALHHTACVAGQARPKCFNFGSTGYRFDPGIYSWSLETDVNTAGDTGNYWLTYGAAWGNPAPTRRGNQWLGIWFFSGTAWGGSKTALGSYIWSQWGWSFE